MRRSTDPVPAELYDSEYYLHHRGGSDEFVATRGKELCEAHSFAVHLADLQSSDRVLDVGCGCGEVALNAAQYADQVIGFDYSAEAIELANEARESFGDSIAEKVSLVHSDIDSFEFPEGHFTVVLLLDVIEHLVQEQIDDVLKKIYSTLVDGGRLIVHTWPNRWHRKFTYPLSYYLGKLSGSTRPRDPRSHHERIMHVAEQSPLELRRNLGRAGFKTTRVFMRQPSIEKSSLYGRIYGVVHSAPVLRLFFCDHIWALAAK